MRRLLSWTAVGVALLLTAVPAAAQAPRAERPYRGLFGSGTGDAGQLLTASGSVGGGYDDNVLADMLNRSSAISRGGSRGGTVTSVSGALAYSFDTESMALGLSVGSGARYYPGTSTDFISGTQGRMSLGYQPRAGTSLSLNVSAAQQPYQFSSLFPVVLEPALGDAPIPDLDLPTTAETYLQYSGTAGFSQRLSRRASFNANYAQHRANRGADLGEFVNQTAGGGLTYNLGKGLDVQAGYAYGEARYADRQTREHHAINAGINYNRSLSISRRTTLSFATGSSAVRSNDRLRYNLVGNAALQHEIGRSWSAWVGYSRRVLLNEVWPDPIVADGVTAGFGGLISRRMQFSSVARGALGRGLEKDVPGFNSVQASASLGYALNRFMSLGVTYSYYQQRFDEGATLSAGIPASAERHSARATVSLWAPLFQRTRSTDASR
jgi:hypothetical protein